MRGKIGGITLNLKNTFVSLLPKGPNGKHEFILPRGLAMENISLYSCILQKPDIKVP